MAASTVSGRVRRVASAVGLRDGVLGCGSVVAIMEQPHIPLGLPGYRALLWFGLLVAVRLVSGAGWPTAVGVAAAVGTLAVGRSPDGVWGVAQYVLAAVVLDAALAARPGLARRVPGLIGVGALAVALVGWIAPVGQGLAGGAGVGDLWFALSSLGVHAWVRLVGFDLLFGAGAAVAGVGLARLLTATPVFAARAALAGPD